MRLLHVRHVPGAVDDVHRAGTADTGCVRSRHDLVFAAPDRNGGSPERGQFPRQVDGGLVALHEVLDKRSKCLIHTVEALVLEQIVDELEGSTKTAVSLHFADEDPAASRGRMGGKAANTMCLMLHRGTILRRVGAMPWERGHSVDVGKPSR